MVEIHQGNSSNATTVRKEQRLCSQCHKLCMKCHGPHPTDCDHCASSYYLNEQSICVKGQIHYIDRDWISFLVVALAICIAAFVAFIGIFVILQAREHGWLCFKSKKRYSQSDYAVNARMNGARIDLTFLGQGRPFLASDSEEDTLSAEIRPVR